MEALEAVKTYISSRENPNVKRLVRLLTSRRFRSECGEFVIEGMRNCVDAGLEQRAGGKIEITAVYYTERAMQRYRDTLRTDVLTELDGRRRFVLADELAGRISSEDSSQEVFVTAKRLDKSLCSDTIVSNGKYLVLDNLQDPGNMGTILRTADAVGISGVVLTGCCCDLYNPKVVRAAMGSIARVDVFIENDFFKAAELFSSKGIVNVASVVDGGRDITCFDFDRPCAVFIGNEGRGMPADHADFCSEKLSIPMKGRINSLNASAAATIILWEMFR